MPTVLLAVTGSSPAVLTETVWALACETPPVIPDLVVTVTTTAGAAALQTQLLTPLPGWKNQSVWQGLRQTLLGRNYRKDPRLTLEPPVLIAAAAPATGTTRDLDDIRTPADNAAAAETILTAVRRFSTDPDTRLLGLLAGGRKTMGALLHAALSLAGRPGDRLLHVLVTEPFDHPRLTPTFYFPGQPGPARLSLPEAKGKTFTHRTAKIELADVPLVALGELVFQRTGQAPATFAAFARAARDQVEGAALQHAPLTVTYAPVKHRLSVNQFTCALPVGRATALAEQLIRDAQAELDLADRMSLGERWGQSDVCYPISHGDEKAFNNEDISHALNEVRNKLTAAGTPATLVDRLFPRRAPIGLNREGVTVRLDP